MRAQVPAGDHPKSDQRPRPDSKHSTASYGGWRRNTFGFFTRGEKEREANASRGGGGDREMCEILEERERESDLVPAERRMNSKSPSLERDSFSQCQPNLSGFEMSGEMRGWLRVEVAGISRPRWMVLEARRLRVRSEMTGGICHSMDADLSLSLF